MNASHTFGLVLGSSQCSHYSQQSGKNSAIYWVLVGIGKGLLLLLFSYEIFYKTFSTLRQVSEHNG